MKVLVCYTRAHTHTNTQMYILFCSKDGMTHDSNILMNIRHVYEYMCAYHTYRYSLYTNNIMFCS